MYSAFRYLVTFLSVMVLASPLWLSLPAAQAAPSVLRVCADPNNLPYSDQQQQGFENRLANLIAGDLGLQVSYTWFPQRGAFFRKTLEAGKCDVVMGVPAGMKELSTTQPYYRSGYVFVSRTDRKLDIHSLDDPRLHQLRIGVHMLGDSDRDSPPVYALSKRGIISNLVGYNIFGKDLDEINPSSDLIKAVEKNEVDIAVAWGPMAGYFAHLSPVPLAVTPIDADPANQTPPLDFDISLGVRAGNEQLKQHLDAVLESHRKEIKSLLVSYSIPQLDLSPVNVAGY